LNTQMGFDLRDLWRDLYVDHGDVRCIVLTGAGEKAFCAGGDLKERNGMTDEQWQRQHAIFEQAVLTMLDVPPPIIAACNGAAYGGGCEFVLAADFADAAKSARLALTEVTLGIMPGAGGTQFLPRAVGIRRAKEFLLTGLPCSAEEGKEWGIFNKVCEDSELMDEALATAERIAGNAPISIKQAKKALNVSTQIDVKNGYAFEIEAYNRMVPTEDRQEGIRAFNEKRKPVYKGE
ncbi:MAG TPA: enoyl-CoA hydratase, partial [Rhodospirillaceae bacterium]|nr:enoyl-CoA hydratase [Rhodospirillaceae bacterium]